MFDVHGAQSAVWIELTRQLGGGGDRATSDRRTGQEAEFRLDFAATASTTWSGTVGDARAGRDRTEADPSELVMSCVRTARSPTAGSTTAMVQAPSHPSFEIGGP